MLASIKRKIASYLPGSDVEQQLRAAENQLTRTQVDLEIKVGGMRSRASKEKKLAERAALDFNKDACYRHNLAAVKYTHMQTKLEQSQARVNDLALQVPLWRVNMDNVLIVKKLNDVMRSVALISGAQNAAQVVGENQDLRRDMEVFNRQLDASLAPENAAELDDAAQESAERMTRDMLNKFNRRLDDVSSVDLQDNTNLDATDR